MVKPIYRMKIVLKGLSPKIWRKLKAPSNLLLYDFHKVIHTSMGWLNEYLHHSIKMTNIIQR